MQIIKSPTLILPELGRAILPLLLREARRNRVLPRDTLEALIKRFARRCRYWVKELPRELERVEFLSMDYEGRKRVYRILPEKAEDAKAHFSRLAKVPQRVSSMEVYRRMRDRPTFTRTQLNEAFSELRLTAIDQMIACLLRRGVLKGVAGSGGRGRYEIIPLEWTPAATQEAAKKQEVVSTVNRFVAAQTYGGEGTVFCYASAMELHRLCRYDVLSVLYLSGGRRFRRRTTAWSELVWIKRPAPDIGVTVLDREGNPVRVSDIERTLIDMLHRPKYCLGTEDILRAIDLIESINAEKVAQYLRILRLPPLFAKLGYFLDRNKDRWRIPSKILKGLRKFLPQDAIYLFPGMPSDLVPDWHIRVPVWLSK